MRLIEYPKNILVTDLIFLSFQKKNKFRDLDSQKGQRPLKRRYLIAPLLTRINFI